MGDQNSFQVHKGGPVFSLWSKGGPKKLVMAHTTNRCPLLVKKMRPPYDKMLMLYIVAFKTLQGFLLDIIDIVIRRFI